MCHQYNGHGFLRVLRMCEVSSQFLHVMSVLAEFLLFTPQLSLQLMHFDLMRAATFYIPYNTSYIYKKAENRWCGTANFNQSLKPLPSWTFLLIPPLLFQLLDKLSSVHCFQPRQSLLHSVLTKQCGSE